MKLVKLSVISPCYNRIDAIEITLLGLGRQTIPFEDYEVIVVDDGSTDESLQILQSQKCEFALRIIHQDNSGPAEARNLGAMYAKGQYYIFIDIDMIPDSNLLASYLDTFIKFPRAVIIGRQIPWPEAYSIRFKEIFYSSLVSDLGDQPINPKYYHLASGNFAVDKTSFECLGGFEREMTMSEDVELGFRAYKNGIKILYNPLAIGYHNHPKKIDQIYHQARKAAWWTARLMAKHSEIYESLIYFQRYKPVSPFSDSLGITIHKIASRIYRNIVIRKIFLLISFIANIMNVNPVFMKQINDRIIMGFIFEGFHQGLKDNDWKPMKN